MNIFNLEMKELFCTIRSVKFWNTSSWKSYRGKKLETDQTWSCMKLVYEESVAVSDVKLWVQGLQFNTEMIIASLLVFCL